MTAREYLSQAIAIKTRLKAMSDQLAFLKSAAEYLPAQFSHLPKPATRNVHKNEDAIVRVLEFEERMKAQHSKLNEISRTIESVGDPLLHTLLVKRYLEGKTWQEISGEMYFSLCHIYRLHNAALDAVQAVIVNES